MHSYFDIPCSRNDKDTQTYRYSTEIKSVTTLLAKDRYSTEIKSVTTLLAKDRYSTEIKSVTTLLAKDRYSTEIRSVTTLLTKDHYSTEIKSVTTLLAKGIITRVHSHSQRFIYILIPCGHIRIISYKII